jgi:hypothetical protein
MMEACERSCKLVEFSSSDGVTACDVAEVEECREVFNHLRGYVSREKSVIPRL